MEIVFFIIAIVVTVLTIYLLGRTLYSHKELVNQYRRSDFLVPIHLVFGLLLIGVLFMTLCAFNNTFWHLPYLTQ